MLPTFLQVMDISVVNVSLPHIQGSLNAGVDEVTWNHYILSRYQRHHHSHCPLVGACPW